MDILHKDRLVREAKSIVRGARTAASRATDYATVASMVSDVSIRAGNRLARAGYRLDYVDFFTGLLPEFSGRLAHVKGMSRASQIAHCGHAFGSAIYTCQSCGGFKLKDSDLCVACSARDPELKAKRLESANRNGGCGFANPAHRRKACRTMRARLGVTWAAQNAQTVRKMQDTCLERYGVASPTMDPVIAGKARDAFAQTFAKRGKEIRLRYEKTMTARYGVNWAVDQANAMMRARYKYTTVTLGDRQAAVQGYEPNVINDMIQQGVRAQDIIPYAKSCTYADSGKQRRYTPDVFVPKLRLVVEVKSMYTAGANYKSMWLVTRKKLQAAVSEFEGDTVLLAVHHKGKTTFIAGADRMTWSQVRKAMNVPVTLIDAVPPRVAKRLRERNSRA